MAIKCQDLIYLRRLGLVRLGMNPNMNLMNLFRIYMNLTGAKWTFYRLQVPIVPIWPIDPFSTR